MKSILDSMSDATQSSRVVSVIGVSCVVIIVVAFMLLLSSMFQKPATEVDGPGLAGAVAVNGQRQIRPIDAEDYVWGPADAPVQLIVYNDFECPFCAQYHETVARAKAEFGDRLVVAIRHFPLISHQWAIESAMAAECAGEQDKFFEMYEALFADNQAGRLDSGSIRSKISELGLDEAAYETCLTDGRYLGKITAQKDEARDLGVSGTPASFLNGVYYPGAVPYEDYTHPDGEAAPGLKTLIEAQLNT